MKADKALGPIEEKIYQSFSLDGAMITSIGCMLLCIGLSAITWPAFSNRIPMISMIPSDFSLLIPICVASIACFLLIREWRRRITFPRLGYSKFIARRDIPHSLKMRYILLLVALDLAFLLSTLFALHLNSAVHPLPSNQADLVNVVGVGVGTIMALAGIILGLKLLWMIVVPMLAMIWLAAYVHVNVGWVAVLAGLLLMGIGLERLRHFLREYPLLVSPDVH